MTFKEIVRACEREDMLALFRSDEYSENFTFHSRIASADCTSNWLFAITKSELVENGWDVISMKDSFVEASGFMAATIDDISILVDLYNVLDSISSLIGGIKDAKAKVKMKEKIYQSVILTFLQNQALYRNENNTEAGDGNAD